MKDYLKRFPIETERLTLRLLDESSNTRWFEAITECPEHFHAWMVWSPYTITQAMVDDICRKYRENTMQGAQLCVEIYEQGSGQFVGKVAATSISTESSEAEVGFWLRQLAAGQGFMYEALTWLCAFLRNDVVVKDVIARVHPENASSRRVLEKVGFHATGEDRDIVDGLTGGKVTGLVYRLER